MRVLKTFAALAWLVAGCQSDVGGDVAAGATGLLAPTHLAGVALPGGFQIRLTWVDNSTTETGFRLDVSDRPIATTADVLAFQTYPANTTTAVYDTTPGTTRHFRVLAVTATHQSDPSNGVMIRTPNVPRPVTGFRSAAVSSSQILLSWNDTTGETSYRLERSVNLGMTWSTAAALPADATFHNELFLAPETEFCFRLFAVNAEGDSLPSDVSCTPTVTASMSVSTAHPGGNTGQFSSIAVSASGIEHLSHYEAVNADCLYTTNAPSGGSFTTTLADATGIASLFIGYDGTSIALDGAGKAHLAAAMLDTGSGASVLRYITNAGGSFLAATLDPAANAPQLRISPVGGSIQIVFKSGQSLRRATLSGGWTFETVVPAVGGTMIGDFSFAHDALGNPHVSYVRSSGIPVAFQLVHSGRVGASWSSTVVPAVGRPEDNSIAVDSHGVIHIAYLDGQNQRLIHATNPGGAWSNTVIDRDVAGSFGAYNSMAIDRVRHVNRLHVAYFDAVRRDLRYARRDPGGEWVRRVVDVTGDVGTHTSVAVDASGAVHISYRDNTTLSLKRASGLP